MATNNFKSFATGASANVTSQPEYESLEALLTGFQSGKASAAQINKALRQSSTMAAVLGQFISQAGIDALDNGNVTDLVNNLISAITKNLSLGTASERNVGTGANQIPDMASFSTGLTKAFKLPSGFIVQFDSGTTVTGGLTKSYPIPFPNQCMALIGNFYSTLGQRVSMVTNSSDRTAANMNVVDQNGNGVSGATVGYIAIGY